MANGISISPAGTLHLEQDAALQGSNWQRLFAEDWREGWFRLSADKVAYSGSPSLRFWQGVANEYLTRVCHFPEEVDVFFP